jgi:hypothetical protein
MSSEFGYDDMLGYLLEVEVMHLFVSKCGCIGLFDSCYKRKDLNWIEAACLV